MAVDLQARLDEAEAAYHALMTGQSVTELRDHNGETIRYSRTDAAKLWGYIQYLKGQLGQLTPGALAPGRVWF